MTEKKLKIAEIKAFMQATERFEFMHVCDHKLLWFWENRWEEEISINPGITMKELIKFIIDYFTKDSYEDGIRKVQTDVKKALGIF